MALIVVGGQAKHVGKTTLVCEIIRHFANAQWLAAKITTHLHEPAQCLAVSSGSAWKICEQDVPAPDVDTGRYLVAGARRSLLVCAESGSLSDACSELKKELSRSPNAIVESTSAVPFLAPDLFILLVKPDEQNVKASTLEHFGRAHVLVTAPTAHSDIEFDDAKHVPRFELLKTGIDAGLAAMVRRSLKLPGS